MSLILIQKCRHIKEKFMQRSVGDSERPQRKLIFIKIENPISPHFSEFFGKGGTIYI